MEYTNDVIKKDWREEWGGWEVAMFLVQKMGEGRRGEDLVQLLTPIMLWDALFSESILSLMWLG